MALNPHQKNKVDVSQLSEEEQKLFRLYGKLPNKKDLLQNKLKERKYFDSGDYAMSKAGKSDAGLVGGLCGKSIDLIIQTCLGSTQAQLAACDDNDWDCLCTQQTNVLTCYNNCPSDPNAFGAQQTQTSYCNAAKAYGSSSSSSSRTVSATASVSSSLSEAIASQSTALAAVTSDGTASSTADSTSSGSASGSAATASETDSSATAFTPAGGLVAAIFGLAALI
ncbi:hypothetical protein KC354_g17860 [Hortaea werneckii]|nr:hypothetical protein KC354_g17860 [Hortaea werneckii]